MSNVDSAKLFFGVVLNKLQASFPAAVFLSAGDLWPEFERLAKGGTISIKTGTRSYRTVTIAELAEEQSLKEHYTKLMLRWMAAEGYLVKDPASNFHYDYVLSSKALAALNIAIDKDKRTIGEVLTNAVRKAGDAAQGELITRIVERIFESFPRLLT